VTVGAGTASSSGGGAHDVGITVGSGASSPEAFWTAAEDGTAACCSLCSSRTGPSRHRVFAPASWRRSQWPRRRRPRRRLHGWGRVEPPFRGAYGAGAKTEAGAVVAAADEGVSGTHPQALL